MKLAKESDGMSGADIENILNEAALLSISTNNEVTEEIVEESLKKVHKSREEFKKHHNEKKDWNYLFTEKNVKF